MRILLYLGFICSFILFISSSNGRAANGSGNTGAPGDETAGAIPVTCKFCHTPSNIVTNTLIQVLNSDNDEVTSYEPGEDYTVKVTINTVSGTPQRYGFQMIGLKDDGNSDLKGFSDPSSNTKLQNISFTNRTYAEHKNPGTLNTFEVKWTAPVAGTGSVSFYAAGNGVNNNGSTNGDGASETKLTLAESVVSSSQAEQLLAQKIQIYPNPVTNGRVFFKWAQEIEISRYTLINSEGRIIHSAELSQDVHESYIDVSNQSPGLYYLNVESKQNHIRPVVKTILIH